MSNDIALPMPDGVQVVVPGDLGITTTYVLREQLDWFEDEIGFLRLLMQPGMRAIDVGANFGVYALTLGRSVGTTGRVWAIEPGAQAADYLARSIAANQFGHVELIRCALSDRNGTGHLDDNVNPELNRLGADVAARAVEVRRLDQLATEHRMEAVDFVKIDVEGEEVNVLEGGREFLAREAPLLMIEFWNENHFNERIFEPLQQLDYDCFRLVPGLDILVPFYESEEPDAYQLNVFACRRPRAERIETAGRLLRVSPADTPAPWPAAALDALLLKPYARAHAARWRAAAPRTGRESAVRSHTQALCAFLSAQDGTISPAARYQALEHAYLELRRLLQSDFTPARAASFIRVATAYGRRAEAVTVSRRLAGALSAAQDWDMEEPLLPPWPYHDDVPVRDDPRQWLLAATVDAFEHLFQFSSCDKPLLAREFLGAQLDSNRLSPEYRRREQLFAQRALAVRTPRKP